MVSTGRGPLASKLEASPGCSLGPEGGSQGEGVQGAPCSPIFSTCTQTGPGAVPVELPDQGTPRSLRSLRPQAGEASGWGGSLMTLSTQHPNLLPQHVALARLPTKDIQPHLTGVVQHGQPIRTFLGILHLQPEG